MKILSYLKDVKNINKMRQTIEALTSENAKLNAIVTNVQGELSVLHNQTTNMAVTIEELTKKAYLRSDLTKRQKRNADGTFAVGE